MAEQTTCHEEVTDTEGMILGACEQRAIARRLDAEDGHTYPVCAEHAVGPLRVQQRRTKGWRKPAGAVSVARPSKWGNEFTVWHDKSTNTWGAESLFGFPGAQRMVVGWHATPAEARGVAADSYRRLVLSGTGLWAAPSLNEIRTALAGKSLMCWCPLDQPCHADVLLELANREDGRG